MRYETYPKDIPDNEDFPLYYIEFHNWDDGKSETWKLYQRNFIRSKEEFDKIRKDASKLDALFMSREGHPWALLEDKVFPDGCKPDKAWLMFMVDALNEKVMRETNPGSWKKLLKDLKDFGDRLDT